MLQLRSGVSTRQGGRPYQQDRYHIDELAGLFVVADGMGGLKGGDVAAQIAVDVCRSITDAGDIWSAFTQANEKIHQEAVRRMMKMGTTCTVLKFDTKNSVVDIGHVGDTRLYRWDDQLGLHLLTTDHSVEEMLVASGVPRQRAVRNRRAHYLTSRLGNKNIPRLDIFPKAALPGNRFLLCSDGVSCLLRATMYDILEGCDCPEDAADQLTQAAVDIYGRSADNATAIVVDVEQRQRVRLSIL